MIADRLRSAILQAAISGKLTDQRPEDGTATELLEQIGAERDALVKGGKQKKQKPLPPVNADEQAFVLPANWVWTSLGETISLLSGRDLTPEQYSDRPDGIPYITGASNFANGSLIVNRWTVQPLTVARQGDLLITCKGTIGDLAVLEEPEAHIARQVMAITCLQVRRDYVAAFLEYSVATLKAQAKSMIPGISRDMLLFTPLPLPPLAEQERIISILDEVLPLIDHLAELEREREHLDREFAQAIERAILQAAISGKLTKQHPEDGTAEELLETIKTERHRLEKEGKIKKQKPLPPVDKEDEPFELPDTWKWTRLGDLGELHTGKTPSSSISGAFGGEIPFVTPGDIEYSGEVHYNNRTVSEVGALHSRSVPPRSVMQVCIGGSAGKTALISRRCCFNQQINAIDFPNHVEPSFIYWHLRSPLIQGQIEQLKAGTATPLINKSRWSTFQIALPPLAEQERIVHTLYKVLPLAHEIKELVS